MKMPSFRRLFTNDFPEDSRSLIDKIAYIFNPDIQLIYDALNKNISLSDNIDCQVISLELTVDSSGIPLNTSIFTLTDKTRNVQGIDVQKAENLTNTDTYPTGGVFLTWQQVQTGVQIQHVTGLPASNKFRLRIVAWY